MRRMKSSVSIGGRECGVIRGREGTDHTKGRNERRVGISKAGALKQP